MSQHTQTYGTLGKPLRVSTNSFLISKLPVKEYTQYAAFKPEVKEFTRRQRMLHKLQVELHPEIFTPQAVYDGRSLLYSSHPLRLVDSGTQTFIVNLGLTPGRGDVRITVSQTTGLVVKLADVMSLIQQKGSTTESTTATNLLQLLIRQQPNLSYPNNRHSYFTDADSIAIGGGIELWRGYFQSVRPTIGRMLVNIDVSVATMYESGDLISVSLKVINAKNVRALSVPAHHPDFRKLAKHLTRLLIKVQSPSMKGRTKTIKGIIPYGGEYKFTKDGQQITVEKHYYDAFNIRLKYPSIIGILVSPKNMPNPVVVPAELCTILPGQLYKRKVPENIQSSGVIGKFSTMKPAERLQAIERGITGKMQSPISDFLQSSVVIDSGMVVDSNAMSINGRVLPAPSTHFGSSTQIQADEGAWNLLNKKLYKPAAMRTWALINFGHDIQTHVMEGFIKIIQRCCSQLGMDVMPPTWTGNGNGQAIEQSLDSAFNESLRQLSKSSTRIEKFVIIAVLPPNAPHIRAQLKLWGDVTKGVITQCICESKLRPFGESPPSSKAGQYCSNVAIKLNARLDGSNAVVHSKILDKLRQKPYMIMGADVSHPGPGTHNRPSVASLVFSHDVHASRYAALSSVQAPRQEIIENLKEMVTKAVDAFGQQNKVGPERIIFFRDGVSEGEYDTVFNREVSAIREGIDEAWSRAKAKTAKPKLTFLIVGKRHHVRFFPQQGAAKDRSGNCPPGFVVDRGLQSPICVDFYLQSHAGIIGTSRPSHYIILLDENFGNNISDIQELAYTLCHVYAKATRSMSIPAPVYYADLVCGRASLYFDPALDFAGSSDAGSVSQDRKENEQPRFDVAEWQAGYRAVHGRMARSMYFL